MKIMDARALDPTTKKPVFLNKEKGGYQSRDLCFPFKILFAKDTKETYRTVMNDFFAFFTQLEKVGLPESEYGPAMRPFRVWSPQDMASQWKSLGMGGSSFTTRLFCACCNLENHRRGTSALGVDRCSRCQSRGIVECFDQPVCDQAFLTESQENLIKDVNTTLEVTYAKVDQIRKQSKLKTDPELVNKENDSKHIDFELNGKKEDNIAEYSQFLTEELVLRHPEREVWYSMPYAVWKNEGTSYARRPGWRKGW
jgi:hypothetical protein